MHGCQTIDFGQLHQTKLSQVLNNLGTELFGNFLKMLTFETY